MPELQPDRLPGFINADANAQYTSANQAFYAYLDASGLPRTKENKGKFRDWLAKAKESGALDKVANAAKTSVKDVLDKKRDELNEKAAKSVIEPETVPDKSSLKILGMKPMVAIGVTVAAIGAICLTVYLINKKNKGTQAS